MFYRVHRVVVGIIMRIFFKKIYIDGLDNLPRDKPLFLVSNHPNGFWEPCVYACTFPFQLHFLVRGDLFKKKAFSWFLNNTNQIPIFRFRDGFKNLRANAGSRSIITEKLNKNARIIVFGEGSSATVKYLRPLQKGMARMAYDAYKQNNELDIKIVPMGITFNEPDGFRKDVMIKVGEPLNFRDYLPLFDGNEGQAKNKITSDTFNAIQPLLLNVTEELSEVYEKAAPIFRNELTEKWLPVVEKSALPFDSEKQLVNRLKDSKFQKLINSYDELTDKMNVSDKHISSRQSLIPMVLWSILLLPAAVIGFVFNAFPSGITFLMAAYVIPRNKFYGSLSGLSRLGLHWYILYPIITIIGCFIYGWKGLLYVPIAVISEWIFYRWWEQIVGIYQFLRLNVGMSKDLAIAKVKRNEILKALKHDS